MKLKHGDAVVVLKGEKPGEVQLVNKDKVTVLLADGKTTTVNKKGVLHKSTFDTRKAAEEAKKAKAAARKAAGKTTPEGMRTSGVLTFDPGKYKHGTDVTTPAGNKVHDTGDAAAEQLRGKSFDEQVKIVATATGRTQKELSEKYGKLNPGMQRMTLGNILRGAINNPPGEKKAKAEKPKAAAKPAKAKKDAPAAEAAASA